MKKELDLFEENLMDLSKVNGGKELINIDCCQDGTTTAFYSHSILGVINWTSSEPIGTKDDCA